MLMSIARLTRTMALSRAFEVLPPILSEATEGVPVPRNSEATKLRPEILLMRGDGASVPFVYKMKSLALSHVRVLASTIIVKNFNGNDIGAFRNATERQRQEAGDKWDTRGKKGQRRRTIDWKQQFQRSESHVHSRHFPAIRRFERDVRRLFS